MTITEQKWFQDHVAAYRTDPAAAHDWDSTPVGGAGIVPTLLLSFTSAVTATRRFIPLLYQPCGLGFIVIGSRGGSHKHPGWYRHLLAHPDCSVQVGRMAFQTRAETLEGEAREKYWDLMTRCWPKYLEYQQRTSRQLPVIRLVIRQASGPL